MNYPTYRNGRIIQTGDFFSAEADGAQIHRILFVAPDEIIFSEGEGYIFTEGKYNNAFEPNVPDFHQIVVWEEGLKAYYTGWPKEDFLVNQSIFLIKRGSFSDDFKTQNEFFTDISRGDNLSLSDTYNQNLQLYISKHGAK